MLNKVGNSSLVSGFFWDDVWHPDCTINDQVPNTCVDMGFACRVNEPHGNSSCQDERLVQLTNDYQKNMQALREAALDAGKFVRVHAGLYSSCRSLIARVLVCVGVADAVDGGRSGRHRRRQPEPARHHTELRCAAALDVPHGQPRADPRHGLYDNRHLHLSPVPC